MRNSKAKRIIDRKEEIQERREGRWQYRENHNPKLVRNGKLNADGTPQVISYVPHTIHNSYREYKLAKRAGILEA